MSTQIVLKLLFELRVVLDRLGENDSTLHEAMAHDIDRAISLANSCIAQLTGDSPAPADAEEEEDE